MLGRLLEKDPVQRIQWEHLRKHPFWTKEVNGRKLPRQPTFDDYLRKVRNVDPDAFAEQQTTEGYFIPDLAIFKSLDRSESVRLSQKVKRNMLKNNQDYQLAPTGKGDDKDIILKSRDQELVFEKGDQDDAENN